MGDQYDEKAKKLWHHSMNKREFMRHFREMLRETDLRARAETKEACAMIAKNLVLPLKQEKRPRGKLVEDGMHKVAEIIKDGIATTIRESKP